MKPFFYLGSCCGFLVLPFILALDSQRSKEAAPRVEKHTAEIILLDAYRKRRQAMIA